MELQAMTEARRAHLLRQYYLAQQAYDRAAERGDMPAMSTARRERERIKAVYFEELPRITASCCPYDGKPLVRSFDPFGFDGLWWKPDADPPELPACTHFCVLRGAVHYQGKKPKGGPFEVWPGPEVPYVIPRLLEKEGMVAVISEVKMTAGYRVFLIAYFARKRPPVQELTANWPRKTFTYKTDFGEPGWKFDNDPWDFELRPWALKGKLRWCVPGGDNDVLSEDPPELCPYLSIEGLQTRIAIEGEYFKTRGLPDGVFISPIDVDD